MIRAGFVDWIVSTGANLYHDTHYALDLPLHQSRPNLDDFALRQNDVIRIYDIVFDYKTLLDTDAFYRELIQRRRFARPMGTAEFHHQVGKYLHARSGAVGGKPANSLLAAAYEAAVPVYTSSPGDSSIGMNLAALSLAGGKLQIDTLRDVNETAAIVYNAKRNGGEVGRLDPRRRQPEELHPPDRAADSGSARPRGKRPRLLPPDHRRPPRHRRPLRRDGHRSDDLGQGRPRKTPRLGDCYTDTTIALPLLTAYSLARA